MTGNSATMPVEAVDILPTLIPAVRPEQFLVPREPEGREEEREFLELQPGKRVKDVVGRPRNPVQVMVFPDELHVSPASPQALLPEALVGPRLFQGTKVPDFRVSAAKDRVLAAQAVAQLDVIPVNVFHERVLFQDLTAEGRITTVDELASFGEARGEDAALTAVLGVNQDLALHDLGFRVRGKKAVDGLNPVRSGLGIEVRERHDFPGTVLDSDVALEARVVPPRGRKGFHDLVDERLRDFRHAVREGVHEDDFLGFTGLPLQGLEEGRGMPFLVPGNQYKADAGCMDGHYANGLENL